MTIEIQFTGKPCSINKRYNKNFSLTNEYRAFKQELGYIAKLSMAKGKTPYKRTSHVYCQIIVGYKGREPDVDSYVKPILDSLNKICWEDDICVKHLNVMKRKINGDGLNITIMDLPC